MRFKVQTTVMAIIFIFNTRQCRSGQGDAESGNRYFLGGISELKAGHAQAAVERFQKGIQAGPQIADNYYWMGLIFLYDAQYTQAIPWLEQAIERQSSDFHVHRDLGLCYLKLNFVGKARAHMEEAVRLNPSSLSSRFNLGLIYARMGFWPQAWREFHLAVTMGESKETFQARPSP